MEALLESPIFDVPHSASGLHWQMRACDERVALAISQRLCVPEIIGRVLAGRGVAVEEAASFLAPTLKDLLSDPSHLKDMDIASARLADAVMANETIAIFGDYDVDGATSSALLLRYLRALGLEPLVHIPDRMKEGYGPNTPALLGLRKKGASVVVTVDCGTLAFEPIAAAREAGLETIVIDHHIGDVRLPEARAVVNPNRFDETSPCKQLAAVGVTFLLLVALSRALRARCVFSGRREPDLRQWLDIVALGTVCDVVPLTGLNRALVSQGLKVMAQRLNPGLNALIDLAGVQEKPTCYHLGFVLGPRINAGGRVGQSDLGVRLLSAEDPLEAQELARRLDGFNAERKTIEALVQEEAIAQAEARAASHDFLLVGSERWHPGVIGIVAGRLKDRFHKPVAVIAFEKGIGKASARSVSGVDLGALVTAARAQGLLLTGGGHAMAAGFSLTQESLPELQHFLDERLRQTSSLLPQSRRFWFDGFLSPGGVTPELARMIERAGPFGAGHPAPRFVMPHCRLAKLQPVGEAHLRLIIAAEGAGRSLCAMAFRVAGTPLGEVLLRAAGRPMHLAGQLRLNFWQGRETADFLLDDAALA